MARFIFPNHLRLSMSSAVIALLLVAILVTGRTAPARGQPDPSRAQSPTRAAQPFPEQQ
jgi:hypothetical protein